MSRYDQLVESTAEAQQYLFAAPIIADVALGNVDLPMYVAFLTNAYHHVRQTVPLMMAAGARIGSDQAPLLADLKDYIVEEIGHERWILNDLKACGIDPQSIEGSKPNLETEVMVSYVRDYIHQVHPMGFFGMVHVLEGTSTSLATATAARVKEHLSLPDSAFSYLTSHGSLDLEHVDFFRALLERVDDAAMTHIVHVAQRVFHLYGNVLRSVPRKAADHAETQRNVA